MVTQDSQSPSHQASEQRISQSSIPCFGLSALCVSFLSSHSLCLLSLSLQVFGSAIFPPRLHVQTYTPPFVLRIGFGAIFAGAGYVLASGDSRNGSGITTAWSLSYFVLEQFSLGLQRSLRLPRSGLSLGLSGATAATAMLYGTEHFFFGDDESEQD